MASTASITDQIMMLVSCSKNQRVRPLELERMLARRFGISYFTFKAALNRLVRNRKLVYTYRDPCTYVEMAAAERNPAIPQMKVVTDADGEPWICRQSADPAKDLEQQGCWRCKDIPFPRNQ